MKRKRKALNKPTVELSHRIELVPTPHHTEYFRKACGTARFTWNWALAEWNRQYAASKKTSAYSLKKAFNKIKYQEFPWLSCIHRDAHAEPFTNLGRAWAQFFKNLKGGKPARVPVFKKKGQCRDSFYVANDKFTMDGKEITLPIIGKVQMRESLRFEGTILGCTVSRSADKWYVSIRLAVPLQKARRKRTGNKIEGVDLGITSAATLSNGEKLESPKPLKRTLRLLKIRARRMSRKLKATKEKAGIKEGAKIPKGTKLPMSNNRRKDTVRLQRLHRNIATIRADWLHKFTSRLCRENQAVGIEDLCVAGMLKNERLARAISDIGMGEFSRQMKYKAKLYGTKVIEADRWFPSSKMCSVCDFVYAGLKLSDRQWICPNCGTIHDRETNAARNLKRLATATALPVASLAAMRGTFDEHSASYGGKVTPVRDEFRQQEGSGQEEKAAVSIISDDHICAPFR